MARRHAGRLFQPKLSSNQKEFACLVPVPIPGSSGSWPGSLESAYSCPLLFGDCRIGLPLALVVIVTLATLRKH